MFKLHLLGSPSLTKDGNPVYIRRRRSTALLAYIALQDRPQSRESLATLFWSEQEQKNALANLRRELQRLKTDLNNELILSDRKTIGIDPDASFLIDVNAFAEAAQTKNPETLDEAIQHYSDDFLSGFTLPSCPEFDEWQYFQREHYQSLFGSALQALITYQEAENQFEQAIVLARRWLLLDTLHEEAHRTLMRLYAKSGQYASAIRQYHICEKTLDIELGAEPEEATKALLTAVQNKNFSPPQTAQSPISQPSNTQSHTVETRNNLPAFPDAFVGRTEEINAAMQILTETDCRLLTLRGIGGIGKTRLAVEVASALIKSGAYSNGLFFVSLAGVTSADFVIPTIAKTLNIPLIKETEPIELIASRIGQQNMLLYLDNFEHLQAAASQLTILLQKCPHLAFLITSRQQLNLAGEQVMVIDGLPLAQVTQDSKASELFQTRALQIKADLSFDQQRPFTHAICELVAGMPLAIEMCAAWVQTLSIQEILTEIQQGIDILESNNADTPERHQSIRAVFQTSFKLLTLAEKQVLQKLTVFQGSFNRPAAQGIAGATLRYLRALVEKSLLNTYHADNETRYQLHPLLRQFLLETVDPVEHSANQKKHAVYYAGYLESLEQKKFTPANHEIETIVFMEVDNVRAVWRWLGEQIAEGQSSEPLCSLVDQLLLSFNYAYLHRNQFLEGIRLLETVYRPMIAQGWVESGTELQQITAAKVGTISAIYRFNANQLEKAMEMSQAVTAVFQKHPTPPYDGYALHTWGLAATRYGDLDVAIQKTEESLAIAKDDSFTPFTILGLGSLYLRQGQPEKAIIYFEKGLALAKSSHEQMGIYMGHLNLGAYFSQTGQPQKAIEQFDTVNKQAMQPGKEAYRVASLTNMANCYKNLGRADKAEKQHQAALALAHNVGREDWIGNVSREIGRLQLDLGYIEQANQSINTALEKAIQQNVPPKILEGLLIMSYCQAQYGHFDKALIMTGFVMNNERSLANVRKEAAEFWDELTSELPDMFKEKAERVLETAVLDDIIQLLPLAS